MAIVHMLCIWPGQLEDECLYCSGAKSTPPGWTAWRSSVVVVWCRYCAHLVPRCLLLQLVRVTGAGVPWAKVTNSFSYIEVLWERDGVPGPCGPQGGQARDLKWDRRAWLGSRVVYLVNLFGPSLLLCMGCVDSTEKLLPLPPSHVAFKYGYIS